MKENTVCISLKEYNEMKWQIDLFKGQKDKITLSTLGGEETFYTSDFLVKELLESNQKIRDERDEMKAQLMSEKAMLIEKIKDNLNNSIKSNQSSNIIFAIIMCTMCFCIGVSISFWIFN